MSILIKTLFGNVIIPIGLLFFIVLVTSIIPVVKYTVAVGETQVNSQVNKMHSSVYDIYIIYIYIYIYIYYYVLSSVYSVPACLTIIVEWLSIWKYYFKP